MLILAYNKRTISPEKAGKCGPYGEKNKNISSSFTDDLNAGIRTQGNL
jgi:hypothetical protein